MPYDVDIVNPHFQFGKADYTFIIRDSDGTELLRQSKKFRDNVTDQQLENEGEKELKAWQRSKSRPEEKQARTRIDRPNQ